MENKTVLDDIYLDVDLEEELDDYLLTPQPPTMIKLTHVFIVEDRRIESVFEEKISLNAGVLSQETLMWYIKKQQKQQEVKTNMHFKVRNMFLYNIDLGMEELPEWVQDAISCEEFIKPMSALDDITIEPTIPLFANMNSFYVMYEAALPNAKPQTRKHLLIKKNQKNTKRINLKNYSYCM
jgi:hypothetical protein